MSEGGTALQRRWTWHVWLVHCWIMHSQPLKINPPCHHPFLSPLSGASLTLSALNKIYLLPVVPSEWSVQRREINWNHLDLCLWLEGDGCDFFSLSGLIQQYWTFHLRLCGDWPELHRMHGCPKDFQLLIDLRCWQTAVFDSTPVICNVVEALNGLTRLECITVRKQGALGLSCARWVLMTQTVPHQCRACADDPPTVTPIPISSACCQNHKQ